jgi:hypothetical protein
MFNLLQGTAQNIIGNAVDKYVCINFAHVLITIFIVRAPLRGPRFWPGRKVHICSIVSIVKQTVKKKPIVKKLNVTWLSAWFESWLL